MTRLRVLETACGVMGPYAGRLFAWNGADVIKCEPARGDWTREAGPFPEERASAGEGSALFVSLNHGKQLVTLDAATPNGRRRLTALVQRADVVLYGPELAAAGITDEDLCRWNPRAVRSHVSAFGLSGPYVDYAAGSIQVLALGGIMGITGDPAREPLQIPGYHPEYIGGIHAYAATCTSLVRRARFPALGGERVETSAFEAVAATAEMLCTLYTYTGAVRSRFHGRQPWGIQGEIMPCKDGHIAVHPGRMGTLALLIGRPELTTEPLFTDGLYRLRHTEEFLALLQPYLAERTRREIIEECEALRIPFGAVLEIPDLLADEQLAARSYFERRDVTGRSIRLPGPPYRTAHGPASEDGPPPGEPVERAAAVGAEKPLRGIRVVDLSWVWAGPAATRILADLGADVIKIESPHQPDGVRALVQDGNVTLPDYWNRGGYFIERNLGKRGMTIDLRTPEGVMVFLALVRRADVVVESFSPRVMPQLGLGFDRLARERPGLIMASLSGYGQTGPQRNRVAYGAALEPEAGITATIGYPDGPPVKTGLAYTDPISGALAAGAILHALYRRLSGEDVSAVHIDLAEREAVLPFMSLAIADYQLTGRLPQRIGNRHPDHWPQGCYPCAGPDRWIAITVRHDQDWRALTRLLGREDLAELTLAERRARAEEIEVVLAGYCGSRAPYALMATLQAWGIPAAVVQNGRDLLHDPHLRARGFFYDADHPCVGMKTYFRYLGAVFEQCSATSTGPAPLLDEHTDAILAELGYAPEAIQDLRARGVYGHRLTEGARPNLALPLDLLVELGALAAVDVMPAATAGTAVR
jgi:crotonobetainyl-CoA:carnitine CoA-transferase CaiB-like acyl-CoA transferase